MKLNKKDVFGFIKPQKREAIFVRTPGVVTTKLMIKRSKGLCTLNTEWILKEKGKQNYVLYKMQWIRVFVNPKRCRS